MELQDLLTKYGSHPNIKAVAHHLSSSSGILRLKGLVGSATALSLAALFAKGKSDFLLVQDDAEQAAYLYHDLNQLLGRDRVYLFPSSYRRRIGKGLEDAGNIILRTEVLNALQSSSRQALVIVSYPEALAEKVLSRQELKNNSLNIKVGEQIDNHFVVELLNTYGFERTDYVYEPGQYAQRGSLIDVYSWAYELPFRIDFFGNEIESIRSFEVDSQLSKSLFSELTIILHQQSTKGEHFVSLLNYLCEKPVLGFSGLEYCCKRMELVLGDLSAFNEAHMLAEITELMEAVKSTTCLEYGSGISALQQAEIQFNCSHQEKFSKRFDFLADHLQKHLSAGYQLCILSSNPKQLDRITAIFEERQQKIDYNPILQTLHEGFCDHDLKLLCYTDHQLFDRFHKYSLRSDQARNGKLALSMKELMQFQFGDYVVHIDHGVGRFGGLFRTEINGKMQEIIKILYKDNDTIFVSIHNLHRISKYRGKEGVEPAIHKLGSGAWERIKNRSKSKIKDIARDLIKLYSQRIREQGFAYSPDSYLQQALEASFIYEDTPDQLKATAEVKKDMELDKPMDRLICGDVGFGKTEVAIRAAFKAVCDNKQVAVLVPTTVLALQHYQTFSERLKDLPCTVDYISRTRTTAEIKSLLSGLSDGKPDILIGTHKLVGKNIKFKDLGLLIIDEEQKFGVGVKEKLKQLKVHVDTLTMTATPIPRTLQFSLMGARDLSLISMPPPNRYPVQTEIYPFDKVVLKEAIEYELDRNGQLFFINNRVSQLNELENNIRKLVPGLRTVIAHGQMNGARLEEIILDFMNHDYDMLICTSIIENGIDIPNANTIFINNAHQFGLSDLHQLRGRVGRTNRKAFCYLFAPPLELLTPDAKRRLQAIENFSELGSGFNIAMQDLDIRGAGNLLGAEQSGFIADLGFEAYQRILNEAMQELRDEEFPLSDTEERANQADCRYVSDSLLESDLSLYFAENYVPGSSERMLLYREMDQLEKEEDIQAFEKRLIDRFGPIPREGQDLIDVVRLRILARQLGMEKIILKNNQMICHFVSNLKSSFYQSACFDRILNYVQQHYKRTRLREQQGKRSLLIEQVNSVKEAQTILLLIHQS